MAGGTSLAQIGEDQVGGTSMVQKEWTFALPGMLVLNFGAITSLRVSKGIGTTFSLGLEKNTHPWILSWH